MSFSIHDGISPTTDFETCDTLPVSTGTTRTHLGGEIHILRDKLTPPPVDGLIRRTRLSSLLKGALAQCCAAVITGRAGTGKTALAADFAGDYGKVAWYRVETADTDWRVFSAYLREAIARAVNRPVPAGFQDLRQTADGEAAISQFLVETIGRLPAGGQKPMLIVLDDLHRIFDADWFGDFFSMLVYSLPETVHLLLLCRSKPPGPLWRLRSKQMLNVVDEKLLAFDEAEAAALLAASGLDLSTVARLHAETYGRASRLIEQAALATPRPVD